MNAEATVVPEGNDAKSASTCTFWCLVIGVLAIGTALPVLGRPYLPTEASFVVGALERLGLLESTPLSSAADASAEFIAALIRVVGATERPLRLVPLLALWLAGCALAHAAPKRGALTATLSLAGLFLPAALSGVGAPIEPSTWLLPPATLLAWWTLGRPPSLAATLAAAAAGGLLALFDPLASAIAAVGVAATLPMLDSGARRRGLFLVAWLLVLGFADRDAWPSGSLGWRAGVPLGLTLGDRGFFEDGRLFVLWPLVLAGLLRAARGLGMLARGGVVLLSLAALVAALRGVPAAPDPRSELDRVTSALLPGDAVVVDAGRDAWRIYARAGHVTRQHLVPIPKNGADGIASELRRVRARRAALCADVPFPPRDCDPVGEQAAGFPLIAPRPERN